MNKTFKKFLLGGFVVSAIGLGLGSAMALSIFSTAYQFVIPSSYGTGAADLFAKWSVPSKSISETTAPKLAFTGIALLDGVCSTSLINQEAYVAVFDTATIASLAASDTDKNHLVSVKARVLTGSTLDSQRDHSCEFFPVPIPATTGLSFVNSAASVRSTLIFRKIQQ